MRFPFGFFSFRRPRTLFSSSRRFSQTADALRYLQHTCTSHQPGTIAVRSSGRYLDDHRPPRPERFALYRVRRNSEPEPASRIWLGWRVSARDISSLSLRGQFQPVDQICKMGANFSERLVFLNEKVGSDGWFLTNAVVLAGLTNFGRVDYRESPAHNACSLRRWSDQFQPKSQH